MLAVSGCGATYWAPGPHQDTANFTQVQAQCRLVSAALWHGVDALDATVMGLQGFNNCMVANGFVNVSAPK